MAGGVNFTELSKNSAASSATEPRRIFSALPSKDSRYSYARDVQAEVWDEWHGRRDESDLVVKMNTGGGKTVVGLLMLQSCLNENIGPVAYLTPDKYLAEQVRKEATLLGIETVDDPRSQRFLLGRAILVENVYRLFNGRSVFGVEGQRPPMEVGAFLIDDAHACLATLEQQFSIRIPAQHPCYAELLALFSAELEQQSAPGYRDLLEKSPSAVVPIPYWAWIDRRSEVLDLLHPQRTDPAFEWAWPLIVDSLPLCRTAISSNEIEIRPPLPPVGVVPSFAGARRRIYLTATLADDSVLVTHFGAADDTIRSPITPRSASDMGDRMILTPLQTFPGVDEGRVREFLVARSREKNVVVIVPSQRRAHFWEPFAEGSYYADTIQDAVDRLRAGHVGLVVFVNKYDGIDLPGDACRILAIDGLPEAYGPLDRLDAVALRSTNAMVQRQIQRIEQGMGRGVRSNDDHCVVLLLGSRLTERLYAPEALRSFSPATRAQLSLSRDIEDRLHGESFAQFEAVVDQCLDRDPGWLRVSRDVLDDVEYDGSGVVSEVALAQREAFDQALVGGYSRAASRLSAAAGAASDNRHAGWLKQQAAAYLHHEDAVSAERLQSSALELNSSLLKPRSGVLYERLPGNHDQAEQAVSVHSKYESVGELRMRLLAICDDLVPDPDPAAVDKFEDAMEDLGRHLGLRSQRPERDTGNGPDVLWSLGGLRFAVIECKSGVTTTKIARKDASQLSHSIDWFGDQYDSGCTAIPVMIHATNVMHWQATSRTGTRVVTFDLLSELRSAVRSYGQSLSAAEWKDTAGVAARLTHSQLAGTEVFRRFSAATRRAPSP